ncbi:hypothetical protein QT979_19850 [Microcoleus sp. w2-18bC1]|uniref:hypothetical protein n=1 Tax=unclassified Microcoleus TaxID=2642155 RepID=UPI002FD59541
MIGDRLLISLDFCLKIINFVARTSGSKIIKLVVRTSVLDKTINADSETELSGSENEIDWNGFCFHSDAQVKIA